MKKISLVTKLILSIIVLITLTYATIHFFVDAPLSFINERTHYMLMGLNFIVLIYLIYRVFNFKNTSIETKVLWTFLLILISPSMLYYIWVTDDKKVINEK
ncbi:hypothetical protein [Abyssalbus ytuae]|uniref:Uncharacterized protein n=1 Tax=Abyssalbus ytuae TaxID=2926907 RepID=A0A9E7CZU9_9FLAO|nr:hypothetical protein [Abyssalbus ytuae]UOB17890.1 hypothetical protein MQE35_01005 [Abyssalbus ytuae]